MNAVPPGGIEATALRSRHPSRVLVVDDEPKSLKAAARALAHFGHTVDSATNGADALEHLPRSPSLVVLDARMPGLDGFGLTARIREDPLVGDVPVLMVTGLDGKEDRLVAVAAGVSDFITKPWEVVELFLRSEAQLKTWSAHQEVKRQRADLEQTVARRTRELRFTLDDLAAAHRHTHQAHLDTIRSLVLAAEFKDVDTAAHVERIRWYADLIARGLGLSPHEVELVREAAPMHDVGKIGIPDAVLLKPGPLTTEERSIMEGHTTIGARILGESDAEVLRLGKTIALSHHERWDGRGYPNGIAGREIPLAGRLCAVADVFDALTMDRCYRSALPPAQVMEMMAAERGRQFDPDVLDVFLDHREEAMEIRERFRDTQPPSCAA